MSYRERELVLIVDDELGGRLLMRATLEEDGFDVIEADSVASARSLFYASNPDLILLDVVLPDGDGIELCAEIRTGSLYNDTPIALVTGLDDVLSIKMAYQAGATDFISKPISWGTLGYRVRYILRSHQTLLELSRNQRNLRLSAKVFDSSNEAILISDGNNFIVSVNKQFEILTGYSAIDVIGRNPQFLSGENQINSFSRNMWKQIQESGHWKGEIIVQHKNKGSFPAWFSISQIRDAEGEPENYIAIFADISERKAKDERIAFLAFHDELTGLPNRRLLNDRIDIAISQAKRERKEIALLFIDLDRFKNINDSLGHPIGDELLKQIAIRLSEIVREGDTVSRMGGDEFLILCPNGTSAFQASTLAEKLLLAIALPFPIFGMPLTITPSIGIAVYPSDGITADKLIQNADAAMYQAKEQGRNTFKFYAPTMNDTTLERLKLEVSLRRALEQQEFTLYFQPKIDAKTGELNGAEALIRWLNSETNIIVSPMTFIPLAEETGLIQAIGEWVLKEACIYLQEWRKVGLDNIPIAVNLSARQFQQGDLIESIKSLLENFNIEPELLELELTESMLMIDSNHSTLKLENIKSLGISLAIDDFGTGFSSLNYLRHFPIDTLKIDKSFVSEIFNDRAALAIIESIIVLAHSLGMHTVAEGVETREQQDILIERGCDTLQGYFIAKPMPNTEFIRWVSDYNMQRSRH